MQQDSQLKTTTQRLVFMTQTGHALNKWKKMGRNSKDRQMRLNQLVQTQGKYLFCLQTIEQKMLAPLCEQGVITKEQANKMFPQLKAIISLSSQLFSDLNKVLSVWDRRTTKIGETMTRYAKFFLIYTQFFKSYYQTQNKIKEILDTNPKAKEIQKELAQPPKIETFESLWYNVFHRPMKYKTLLGDYWKKLWKEHPDHRDLQLAMDEYNKVVDRNNLALEHKQKSNTLVTLDEKFGGIIKDEAQYFVSQSDAIMNEVPVRLYLFSNMLLIAEINGQNQKELKRMQFNEYSYAYIPKDMVNFKNRLFICGKLITVHLSFQKPALRDEFEAQVYKITNQMQSSELTRTELGRGRTTLRTSMLSMPTAAKDTRGSFTQTPVIIEKPPRIIAVGYLRRQYSSNLSLAYLVIKFMLPQGKINCQQLYVEVSDLIKLERIMRNLYPKQLENVPFVEQQAESKGFETKNFEVMAINATIFLNTLFRDPKIMKRTDLVGHMLGILDGFWLYCRISNLGCVCHYCLEGQILKSVKDYQRQMVMRRRMKEDESQGPTFYCPFRTIQAQNLVNMANPKLADKAGERIFTIRCNRGYLDYRLMESTPLTKHIIIHVKLQKVEENQLMEFCISSLQRVGQILQSMSEFLQISLQDFELFALIGDRQYMLGRDEILARILKNQVPPEEGVSGFFKNVFSLNEDTSIRLILRRVLAVEPKAEMLNFEKEPKRVLYLMESLMYRIRAERVQLSINDTTTFLAAYHAYRTVSNPSKLKTDDLKQMVPERKWEIMDGEHRKEMLDVINEKAGRLRRTYTEPGKLNKAVRDYLGRLGSDRPGWSAFLFDGYLLNHPHYPKNTRVRVGIDISRLYVKQPTKLNNILQYPWQDIGARLVISVWQLHIKDEPTTFILRGDSWWQLQEMIDMLKDYRSKFKVSSDRGVSLKL